MAKPLDPIYNDVTPRESWTLTAIPGAVRIAADCSRAVSHIVIVEVPLDAIKRLVALAEEM